MAVEVLLAVSVSRIGKHIVGIRWHIFKAIVDTFVTRFFFELNREADVRCCFEDFVGS